MNDIRFDATRCVGTRTAPLKARVSAERHDKQQPLTYGWPQEFTS
jgi:hypothetical protein